MRIITYRVTAWSLALLACLTAAVSHAQQMQRFGDFELHYIVIPTTTLQPDIAARYDISRGKDKALCNISVIDANGNGVSAVLEGSTQNLLGQRQDLSFREVVDGDAIYYLATIRHANEEVHRINIDARVQASSGVKATSTNLKITQKLYWSE
ncbi:MAG: hypothetical protein CMQ10_00560 [Gammaproteobacteria bacterium]|nr:hypothetical protein [Gammaproteobacteria bacterium]